MGSGFLIVFDEYRRHKLPEPTIIEGSGFVKCILPRPGKSKVFVPQQQPETELMRLFLVAEEIGVQDVISHFSVSRQTASRLLSKCVKLGLIHRTGKGARTCYVKL